MNNMPVSKGVLIVICVLVIAGLVGYWLNALFDWLEERFDFFRKR